MTCVPQPKSFKIIGEGLATNQTEVLYDKHTIVGACILNISEKYMFDF